MAPSASWMTLPSSNIVLQLVISASSLLMGIDSLIIDASINIAAFSSRSLSRTPIVYGRQRTVSVASIIFVVSGGRNSAVSGYVGQSVTIHGTSALRPN
jgi:hypothetical protein